MEEREFTKDIIRWAVVAAVERAVKDRGRSMDVTTKDLYRAAGEIS